MNGVLAEKCESYGFEMYEITYLEFVCSSEKDMTIPTTEDFALTWYMRLNTGITTLRAELYTHFFVHTYLIAGKPYGKLYLGKWESQ